MSKKRQPAILDPHGEPTAVLTTLTYEFAPYYQVPDHFHEEAQLLFASKGVMTIRSGNRSWVVPPQKAVWVPARAVHAIQMSKAVSMRTLYFVPRLVRRL